MEASAQRKGIVSTKTTVNSKPALSGPPVDRSSVHSPATGARDTIPEDLTIYVDPESTMLLDLVLTREVPTPSLYHSPVLSIIQGILRPLY